MKKSELSVIVFMLLFCAFFFYETVQLPVLAQRYPLFVIGLLAFLTLLKFFNMCLAYMKDKKIIDDFSTVWKSFLPKQFFTVFLGFLGFFGLMYFLGFYIAALVFLLFALIFFKIPKKYIVLTLVVMLVIVYAVFTWFLNVPLPEGMLIENFF
ncbi:MAG: tripartite tricarboxylate transporter TctB family protein [Acidaminococcaceae bacterium]|jgi:hypothetical protein|nr:tripartite tricarboxylate transporter TctB family protein [Acidaminococcaceae bacterium]